MQNTEVPLYVGTLAVAGNSPALIYYAHTLPLVFAHNSSTQQQASDLCEGIALQLLKLHDAGKARLHLYEATPGRLFSQIKRLYAKTDKTWGKCHHALRDFGQLLGDLHTQAHRRYSLLTATDTHDIYSYNATARKPEEIIYLLITALRPLSAETKYMNLLDDLCRQGPAVGIVPILLRPVEDEQDIGQHDQTAKVLRHFWETQYEAATGFVCINGVTLHRQNPELCRLFTKYSASFGVADDQCRKWSDELIEATQKAISTEEYQDFLSVPIGQTGVTQALFSMGDRSHAYHALIGGATGTGKTTLLNSLIIKACETFTPQQLRLWLFDYKKGISFGIYKDLPHCDLLHTDYKDTEYAISAFKRFLEILDERADLFKQCTPPATSLHRYNQVASTPLPYCILILDELKSLFEDRKTKIEAKRLIGEIASMGRAFGMHLVFSTVSYRNVDLDDDAKAQFGLRIGFKLANAAECRALMGKDNDAPMRLERFTAVYNSNFGDEQDNRIVALDPLGDDELYQRIQKLKARYPDVRRSEQQFRPQQTADNRMKPPMYDDDLDD